MPAIQTIQLRRGTAASWTAANPILAAGEPGFETDTGKLKIGNGSTVWNSLAYTGGGNVAADVIWNAKGDLAAASAADTAAALTVGSNGQVLTADSAQTLGVKWATPSSGGNVASDTIWDNKGDIAAGTGADTAAVLPVGTNNQMLVADSLQTSGLRWQTPLFVGTDTLWNAKGDLAVGTSNDHASALSAGTNGQVLTADSTAGTGLRWSAAGTGRTVKRVSAVAGPTATPTLNTDSFDVFRFTVISVAITSMTTGLSGTPVDGDEIRISFTDSGVGRAITWGTSYEASTVALPTTTVANARLDVHFYWNVATTKWRCVMVA